MATRSPRRSLGRGNRTSPGAAGTAAAGVTVAIAAALTSSWLGAGWLVALAIGWAAPAVAVVALLLCAPAERAVFASVGARHAATQSGPGMPAAVPEPRGMPAAS